MCYPLGMVLTNATATRAASCLILLTSLAALLASRDAGAEEWKLIEGFEARTILAGDGSKLGVVSSGRGVTEGKQAVVLPPAASITLKLNGRDWQKFPWLRIDTFLSQPRVERVRFEFIAPGLRRSAVACIQPGRDSIAVPISVVVKRGRWNPLVSEARLVLTNIGAGAIVLDHVRLGAGPVPPTGAVLVDFGPENQPVWPGFTPAGPNSSAVVWSGKNVILAQSGGFPDPLTGDQVGPRLAARARDSFRLAWPGGASTRAWLWMTHYGTRKTQPAEAVLSFRGAVQFRTRLSKRRLLGADGLLAGKDQPWTADWFDTRFAPRFVELVTIEVPPAGGAVELGNCQLAALAMAPPKQQQAMSEYVKQVRRDLSRYRRQFVVGFAAEAVCDVEPGGAEIKSGLMAFRPPPDDAFTADWRPAEADRLKMLKATTVNGGLATIPLAVVPLKKSAFITATMADLRSEKGTALATAGKGADVLFVERAPRALAGRTEFQPWVLSRKHGPVEPRRVVHVAIVVQTSATARAGTYHGQVRLRCSAGRVELPVELEVIDAGKIAREAPLIGSLSSAVSTDLYGAVAEGKEDALTARIRQQLTVGGLGGLTLDAPFLNRKSKVIDDTFVKDLATYPSGTPGGLLFLSLRKFLWRLPARSRQPGTRAFLEALRKIVGRVAALTSRRQLPGYCFYLGRAFDEGDLASKGKIAGAVASAGGRSAVLVRSSMLNGLARDRARSLLDPFHVIVLQADAGQVDSLIRAIKQQNARKRVYLYSPRSDRYILGFYAAAVGADGCYLAAVFMSGPAYGGFWLDGSGLLVPRSGGTLAETLAMLRLRQGVDDYLLMRRADALLADAAKAKAPAAGLKSASQNIRRHATKLDGVAFDTSMLRSDAVSPRELVAAREALIRSAGEVAQRLRK